MSNGLYSARLLTTNPLYITLSVVLQKIIEKKEKREIFLRATSKESSLKYLTIQASGLLSVVLALELILLVFETKRSNYSDSRNKSELY